MNGVNRKLVAVCAVALGGLILYAYIANKRADEEHARAREEAAKKTEPAYKPWPPPADAAPPIARETSFEASAMKSGIGFRNETEQKNAAELELAAARRVYERCSHLPAWKGGPQLEGTLVYKGKAKTERVNVKVDVVDKAATNGHTLWYMITFDAKKAPAMIQAKKEISATLCGLDEPDVDYPL